MRARRLRSGGVVRHVGVRERAGVRAAAVADCALERAACVLPAPPVVALTPVDDHRDVRVVLVVLDHLVVELVRELARDHAVDHSVSDSMEALRRHQWLAIAGTAAGVVAAALAAGCGSHSKRPRPVAILRVSCDESWVPTAETFKGFRGWRRTSIRIGPITLMGAKAAAHRDIARYGQIKFRTLVRLQTPVRIEIEPSARSAVGFVAPNDALRELWPKHGAPIMQLAPCPMNFLPYHGLRAIGYPMFLRVRHNACVP